MRRPAPPTLSAAVLLGFGRSAGDPATRPLHVLVADADPARRERLRLVLTEAGMAALSVNSWPDVLAALSRTALDAVVHALDLPGAGGLAAARVLRGWPPPVAGLPLLGLKADGARVQEKDWRDAGLDALLLWPGDCARLAALVRETVMRLTPPDPLDRARRAALRESLGPAAL
ncbi:MAG: hypothetical protein K2X74_10470, partial [Acetobacteraceae bacterium]|nr:hypothetical protein [Acetobacteraceae bacterium]